MGGVCLTPNVIYGATVKILDIFGDPIDLTKETYTGLSEPHGKKGNMGIILTSNSRKRVPARREQH